MQRSASKHWRAITLGAYANANDHSWLSTNTTVYNYGFLAATRNQGQCVLQLPPLLATHELRNLAQQARPAAVQQQGRMSPAQLGKPALSSLLAIQMLPASTGEHVLRLSC